MRFVITGEWSRNHLLRLILFLFAGYIACLWVSNALMYFSKMDLTPASVIDYYRGNEALFTQPRTYQGMLEVTHFHLFAMGILVMTLTHLLLFIPVSLRLKGGLTVLTFFSAIGNELAGWGVRFLHPSLAVVKIGLFLLLQGSLLALLGLLVHGMLKKRRNAYSDSQDSRE